MAAESSPALDALGNETRRQILRLLREAPQTVGELASRLPVSRPAVSKHLRLLEQARLVHRDVVGRRTLVRLDSEGFEQAHEWLEAFWDEALGRFKLLAENTEQR